MKQTLFLILLCLASFASGVARDLSGCQKWGLAPNDYSKLTTVSYLVSPGYYGEGLRMRVSKEMADCTIEGISVPVCMTEMKNLRCFVCSDKNFMNVLAEVSVPDGTLKKGYNDIAFDAPIPVPTKDVYVGYTYTLPTKGTSLMVYDAKADESLYLSLEAGSWLDYSPYGMGVSALQVIIGSQNLEDYSVYFKDIEWPNVLCGEGTVRATLRSSSKKSVESVSYSVTIDGVKQTGDISFATPIAEGMNKDATVDITFATPATPHKFDAIFSIDAVNGTDNAQPEGPFTAHLNGVSRRVERLSVVEEITGTGCGFCPRGWVGMEYMKKNFPGQFAGICMHQYNTDDPMANYNYAKLGFMGAPACTIDRASGVIDPYNGSGFYKTVLGDFADFQRLLPDVEVTGLSATLADNKKTVTASAEVEFLTDIEGYTIGYALTADGLHAPTTASAAAWAQSNYFASMEASSVVKDELPELTQFCQGGELGTDKVNIIFNDVMIASSWNKDGKLLTDAIPSACEAGSTAQSSYTLTLPTNSMLLKALDYDALYLTVLVIDAKGRIANAGRTKVEVPALDGISAPATIADTDEASYDLLGRRVATPTKGVTLRRDANGNVRKMIVR